METRLTMINGKMVKVKDSHPDTLTDEDKINKNNSILNKEWSAASINDLENTILNENQKRLVYIIKFKINQSNVIIIRIKNDAKKIAQEEVNDNIKLGKYNESLTESNPITVDEYLNLKKSLNKFHDYKEVK